MARHGQGLVIKAGSYQAGELARTSHVCALADVREVLRTAVDEQRLKPREPQALVGGRHRARSQTLHSLCDGANMALIGAAATTDNVQQAVGSHLPEVACSVCREFVIFAHLVGQSGIGVKR